MKACVFAAAVLAVSVQHDASAATAGLTSPDPAVRAKSACDLRELGRQAVPAIPQLVALLADGSPVDRAVCSQHTWRFRGATDSTTPGEQAASALVGIGSPAQPALLKALSSSAWIARRNAAWGLGALDSSEAVPALIEALNDTDAGVREQVAWALGAIGDKRAVPALIKCLKDPVAAVRKQAAWALGAIEG